MRRREAELDQPGAIERANSKGVTVQNMIKQYLDEMEKVRPLGKTKEATLNAIAASEFGQTFDSDITSQRLVDFALWRMSGEGGGVQPQTAGNDLAHLGAVLSIWGYEVDIHAMGDARKVLRKLGYNMKSRERDRRPPLGELDKLFEHFTGILQRRPSSINMLKVAGFALF